MNGRELDAYDVEFTFQRNFGIGEFAERALALALLMCRMYP